MPSQLDSLKNLSTIVADTGDLSAIRQYQPIDATTNPSLILKAFELTDYQPLIDHELRTIPSDANDLQQQVRLAVDRLSVAMGREVTKLVPGRVSTEVAARLSFDVEGSIRKAHELIDLYQERGVSRDRVLIKLASTWEGIRAAELLEKEGINCNLTLLFSEAQAQACFDAGVFLVSPFVGRVTDWYKQETGQNFTAETDPGVQFVRSVCQRVNQGGYKTIVMGASFRNIGQILALAGCPRLTISPALLQELADNAGDVAQHVIVNTADGQPSPKLTESRFRWGHNQDAMATAKLAEGICRFAQDQDQLEGLIADRLATR
jgi:transaldolase